MQTETRPVLGVPQQRSRSYWTISLRRLLRKKVGVACLCVIVLMYGAGIFSAVVPPYGYNDQNLVDPSTKAGGCRLCQGPSFKHPFGTDRLGRDVFTRIIYGLRTTVIITITTLVTGSLAIGITMGLLAGYFGRLVDAVIMRVGEVTSAFPEIFLVLIIIASVKPPVTEWVRGIEDTLGVDIIRLGVVDYLVLSLALAIFSWFGMARLVRGQVLQARENQYVEAAVAVGGSTPRILLRHILPNVMGPVIVVVSAGLAAVAGSEIFLSFLGIGIQPPTPSLGLMIFENGSIAVLRTTPHLLLFPVGTLSVLLLTFSMLGDAVNDAFNPRAR